MTVQYITPESDSTKGRYVVLAHRDANGGFVLSGDNSPLPTISNGNIALADGVSYAFGVVRGTGDTVPSGQSIDIAIAFAEGVQPRMNIEGLASGNAEGYLYEGATVSGGTAATALSRNRNSAIVSQSAILVQPTVADVGTLLVKKLMAAGVGVLSPGAGFESPSLILKPLTTYLLRLTNVSGFAERAEIIMTWYE